MAVQSMTRAKPSGLLAVDIKTVPGPDCLDVPLTVPTLGPHLSSAWVWAYTASVMTAGVTTGVSYRSLLLQQHAGVGLQL